MPAQQSLNYVKKCTSSSTNVSSTTSKSSHARNGSCYSCGGNGQPSHRNYASSHGDNASSRRDTDHQSNKKVGHFHTMTIRTHGAAVRCPFGDALIDEAYICLQFDSGWITSTHARFNYESLGSSILFHAAVDTRAAIY